MELKDLLWQELNRETFHDAEQIVRKNLDFNILDDEMEGGNE
jgi:GTP-binding protein